MTELFYSLSLLHPATQVVIVIGVVIILLALVYAFICWIDHMW